MVEDNTCLCRKMVPGNMKYTSLFTTTIFVICLTSITVSAADTPYFYCSGDYCNVEQNEQFCSDTLKKCRDCSDIVDDCLTSEMPINCSRTCINHIVEQRLEIERDTTCKRLPPVLNGAWSNISDYVFKLGQTIYVVCNVGFTLKGSRIWACSKTGWLSIDKETEMPACFETAYIIKPWLVALIAIGCAILAVCITVVITCCCKKDCHQRKGVDLKCNYSKLEQSPTDLNKPDLSFEKQANENEKQNNNGHQQQVPFNRTVSLEEAKQSRIKALPYDKENNAQVPKENEKLPGRSESEAAENQIGRHETNHGLTLNFNINSNTSNNLGNANTSISRVEPSTSDSKIDNIQTGRPNNATETNHENLKTPQEESGTFEQRQPEDAVAQPTSDIESSVSTTVNTDRKIVNSSFYGNQHAVTASANNEQDIERKLVLGEGEIQPGDISRTFPNMAGHFPMARMTAEAQNNVNLDEILCN